MKEQRGITLVALVVTIVVLIILAGISINLILGDNGIITVAKKAKENTELAKIEEETELNEIYMQIMGEGSDLGNLPYDSIAKLVEFKIAIAEAIDEAGGIKPDISAETSIFVNNIKGILKEVTKNATATENDILNNKTAYKDGKLIVGTIENRGEQKDWIPTTSETKTYEAGYYPSSWTVSTNNAYNEGVNNSVGKIIFSQTNGNGANRYNPYIDLNYFQYISSANTGSRGTIVKVKVLKDCKGYAQIRDISVTSTNGTSNITSTGHTNHTYASNITNTFEFKSGDILTITASGDNGAIHLMTNVEFSATLVNCGWTTE